MSETRYGREYGTGTLVGDRNLYFFDSPLMDQVREIGYSHACPVVDQVIAEYGPKWTLNRYAECNFIFGLIVNQARKINPTLANELTSPVKRLASEPVGVFNPRFTPESHKHEMAPLATLWGYALPRIVIEQMGRGKNNIERTKERTFKALDITDDALKTSSTPIEFVVKIAERVSLEKADPKAVLSHLLASGVVAEENCKKMYAATLLEIEHSAPNLWKTYKSITIQEEKELGIGMH